MENLEFTFFLAKQKHVGDRFVFDQKANDTNFMTRNCISKKKKRSRV